MSVHRKDGRWVVRWRDDGRQRSRSFPTKRQAAEFDRDRQREAWRESVATPSGTVSAETASHKMTFVVVESSVGERTLQREIHEGYFPTIPLADAYRRQMPDADALGIRVLYARYPIRDLTDEEIAAGEAPKLDLDSGNDDWIARARRLVDEHEVTR